MYFITSIYKPERFSENQLQSNRCFGYYDTEFKAKEAVHQNRGQMQECLYNFLVIERIGQGIHRMSEAIQWYEWRDDKWTEISPPKFSVGVINYAIG